jgi:3-methyladenine DNA glycosylase AlkD
VSAAPTTAKDLVERIVAALDAHSDPTKAPAMEAYMRNQFAFLGVPSPGQQEIFREVVADLPRVLPDQVVATAAVDLWALPQREYQYVACRVVNRHTASGGASAGFLATVQHLLTTKPWWDTVDTLATRSVGDLVRQHPSLRITMDKWLVGDDMWLTRSALLHMNRWKAAADQQWLFAACLRRSADTDFFIRKAIGWALREHSKVDEAAVVAFVEQHDELSGLSRREALMWLERRRRRTDSA